MSSAWRLRALGLVCCFCLGGQIARATPTLRVEVAREPAPMRLLVGASLGAGWDDNVRQLAPVELFDASVPLADGFGSAGASARLSPANSGPLLSTQLQLRRFLAADNGVLGGGSARAGWRFVLGPAFLEPAVAVDGFAWSAFPSDRHAAASFAPALVVRRARLTVGLWPTVLGRYFDDGTDAELWLTARGTWSFGGLDLTLGYEGGRVAAAQAVLDRALHEAILELAWLPASSWSAGVGVRAGSKRLARYETPEGGVGRSDRLFSGSAWVRWRLSRAFALVGSADAQLSRSSSAVGEWDRLVGALNVEWSWARRPATRANVRRAATLVARAPGARSVAVAGSFSRWEPLPMAPQPDGTFLLKTSLRPGEHRLGLVVDGEWVVPGGMPVATDAFGGTEAVLEVRSE